MPPRKKQKEISVFELNAQTQSQKPKPSKQKSQKPQHQQIPPQSQSSPTAPPQNTQPVVATNAPDRAKPKNQQGATKAYPYWPMSVSNAYLAPYSMPLPVHLTKNHLDSKIGVHQTNAIHHAAELLQEYLDLPQRFDNATSTPESGWDQLMRNIYLYGLENLINSKTGSISCPKKVSFSELESGRKAQQLAYSKSLPPLPGDIARNINKNDGLDLQATDAGPHSFTPPTSTDFSSVTAPPVYPLLLEGSVNILGRDKMAFVNVPGLSFDLTLVDRNRVFPKDTVIARVNNPSQWKAMNMAPTASSKAIDRQNNWFYCSQHPEISAALNHPGFAKILHYEYLRQMDAWYKAVRFGVDTSNIGIQQSQSNDHDEQLFANTTTADDFDSSSIGHVMSFDGRFVQGYSADDITLVSDHDQTTITLDEYKLSIQQKISQYQLDCSDQYDQQRQVIVERLNSISKMNYAEHQTLRHRLDELEKQYHAQIKSLESIDYDAIINDLVTSYQRSQDEMVLNKHKRVDPTSFPTLKFIANPTMVKNSKDTDDTMADDNHNRNNNHNDNQGKSGKHSNSNPKNGGVSYEDIILWYQREYYPQESINNNSTSALQLSTSADQASNSHTHQPNPHLPQALSGDLPVLLRYPILWYINLTVAYLHFAFPTFVFRPTANVVGVRNNFGPQALLPEYISLSKAFSYWLNPRDDISQLFVKNFLPNLCRFDVQRANFYLPHVYHHIVNDVFKFNDKSARRTPQTMVSYGRGYNPIYATSFWSHLLDPTLQQTPEESTTGLFAEESVRTSLYPSLPPHVVRQLKGRARYFCSGFVSTNLFNIPLETWKLALDALPLDFLLNPDLEPSDFTQESRAYVDALETLEKIAGEIIIQFSSQDLRYPNVSMPIVYSVVEDNHDKILAHYCEEFDIPFSREHVGQRQQKSGAYQDPLLSHVTTYTFPSNIILSIQGVDLETFREKAPKLYAWLICSLARFQTLCDLAQEKRALLSDIIAQRSYAFNFGKGSSREVTAAHDQMMQNITRIVNGFTPHQQMLLMLKCSAPVDKYLGESTLEKLAPPNPLYVKIVSHTEESVAEKEDDKDDNNPPPSATDNDATTDQSQPTAETHPSSITYDELLQMDPNADKMQLVDVTSNELLPSSDQVSAVPSPMYALSLIQSNVVSPHLPAVFLIQYTEWLPNNASPAFSLFTELGGLDLIESKDKVLPILVKQNVTHTDVFSDDVENELFEQLFHRDRSQYLLQQEKSTTQKHSKSKKTKEGEAPLHKLTQPSSHPKWSIPQEELAVRTDLRDRLIFSVDPITAKDLDDALSVEYVGLDTELDCGLEDACGKAVFRVGVHIADVSYFVRTQTLLDAEATQRSTSVYLSQFVVPMLPRLLSEDLCSLNPAADRLAFSCFFLLDEDGHIRKVERHHLAKHITRYHEAITETKPLGEVIKSKDKSLKHAAMTNNASADGHDDDDDEDIAILTKELTDVRFHTDIDLSDDQDDHETMVDQRILQMTVTDVPHGDDKQSKHKKRDQQRKGQQDQQQKQKNKQQPQKQQQQPQQQQKQQKSNTKGGDKKQGRQASRSDDSNNDRAPSGSLKNASTKSRTIGNQEAWERYVGESAWFGKTIIRSAIKLDYGTVQELVNVTYDDPLFDETLQLRDEYVQQNYAETDPRYAMSAGLSKLSVSHVNPFHPRDIVLKIGLHSDDAILRQMKTNPAVYEAFFGENGRCRPANNSAQFFKNSSLDAHDSSNTTGQELIYDIVRSSRLLHSLGMHRREYRLGSGGSLTLDRKALRFRFGYDGEVYLKACGIDVQQYYMQLQELDRKKQFYQERQRLRELQPDVDIGDDAQKYQQFLLQYDDKRKQIEYHLNKTVQSMGLEQSHDTNTMIEEYMLLANLHVAKRVYRIFPSHALLRNHPPPREEIATSAALLKKFGVHVDITSSASTQSHLVKLGQLYDQFVNDYTHYLKNKEQYASEQVYWNQANDGKYSQLFLMTSRRIYHARSHLKLVATEMLTSHMNRALYFCTGNKMVPQKGRSTPTSPSGSSSDSNKPGTSGNGKKKAGDDKSQDPFVQEKEWQKYFHHHALNFEFYTHFTSPIRRYPDIVVHRLLEASFTIEPPINTLPFSPVYDEEAIFQERPELKYVPVNYQIPSTPGQSYSSTVDNDDDNSDDNHIQSSIDDDTSTSQTTASNDGMTVSTRIEHDNSVFYLLKLTPIPEQQSSSSQPHQYSGTSGGLPYALKYLTTFNSGMISKDCERYNERNLRAKYASTESAELSLGELCLRRQLQFHDLVRAVFSSLQNDTTTGQNRLSSTDTAVPYSASLVTTDFGQRIFSIDTCPDLNDKYTAHLAELLRRVWDEYKPKSVLNDPDSIYAIPPELIKDLRVMLHREANTVLPILNSPRYLMHVPILVEDGVIVGRNKFALRNQFTIYVARLSKSFQITIGPILGGHVHMGTYIELDPNHGAIGDVSGGDPDSIKKSAYETVDIAMAGNDENFGDYSEYEREFDRQEMDDRRLLAKASSAGGNTAKLLQKVKRADDEEDEGDARINAQEARQRHRQDPNHDIDINTMWVVEWEPEMAVLSYYDWSHKPTIRNPNAPSGYYEEMDLVHHKSNDSNSSANQLYNVTSSLSSEESLIYAPVYRPGEWDRPSERLVFINSDGEIHHFKRYAQTLRMLDSVRIALVPTLPEMTLQVVLIPNLASSNSNA